MNRKLVTVIIASSAVILAGGAIAWWVYSLRAPAPVETVQTVTDMQGAVDVINQRAIEDMPSENDAADSTGSIPNVNPYRNTNPFNDVKTNPFE